MSVRIYREGGQTFTEFRCDLPHQGVVPGIRSPFEYKHAHRSFIAMGWGETPEWVLCPKCKVWRQRMGKMTDAGIEQYLSEIRKWPRRPDGYGPATEQVIRRYLRGEIDISVAIDRGRGVGRSKEMGKTAESGSRASKSPDDSGGVKEEMVMGKDTERRGGLTVNLDTGKFEKQGPKGHNKLVPGGAEDGAPNARPAPAISTGFNNAFNTKTPSDADEDGIALTSAVQPGAEAPEMLEYAKALTVPEIKAFCIKNGIEVSQTPANGGVMKMRHLNAVKAAIRHSKALVK